MKVWLLPIEPVTLRYSADWERWVTKHLQRLGHAVVSVCPAQEPDGVIRNGEFLDAIDTNVFKMEQMAAMLRLVQEGAVDDGDVVLFLDAWNPALLSLVYARQALGKAFRIAGYVHAGTWDPHDFLTRVGMGTWAHDFEASLFRALDVALVGSAFHARLIQRQFGFFPAVVGQPFDAAEVRARCEPMEWAQRPPLVVFPHRLAPEKNVEGWRRIRALYAATFPNDEVEWVETAPVAARDGKGAYYRLLGRARVVVSTALQETYGIAMTEAVAAGAAVLVPNRLSYQELYASAAVFISDEDAVQKLNRWIHSPAAPLSFHPVRLSAEAENFCLRLEESLAL